MKTPSYAFLVSICLCLPQGSAHQPAEEGEAQQIMIDAIEAIGGAKNLARVKAISWSTHSEFSLQDDKKGRCKWKNVVQWPDKFHYESDDGSTLVLNGTKGWLIVSNRVSDWDLDRNRSILISFRVDWMSKLLLPISAAPFSLKTIGATKVDGRAAVGVQAEWKHWPAVKFYFDKETKLLVKSEVRMKGHPSGPEMCFETLYSDYRSVNSVKFAHKHVVRRDSSVIADDQVSELRILEKIDPQLFVRPELIP
jgi:hypothetical protein